MGANLEGGGDKKSVNVDLNVTPFVDLLVCLTAFLLVTAVWSNLAQINIKPKGVGRDAPIEIDEEELVRASILITEQEVWVGLSRINQFDSVKKVGETHSWDALEELLVKHKQSGHFTDRYDIEIAAEDKIDYQTIITAMDRAINAGFKDVGLTEPASLSARPQL